LNGINQTTIQRHSASEVRAFRQYLWLSILMGLGVVFFGIQLLVVGPLKGRLDRIQTRLEKSESSMNRLVASGSTAGKTNDLLTSLNQQAGHLAGLRGSLAEIRALHDSVKQEGTAAAEAMTAVEQIAQVQDRLIAGKDRTTAAGEQLAAMEALQQAILDGAEGTEVADASLQGIVALQNRLIASSGNYEQASEGAARMADLAQRVIAESDDVAAAAEKFNQFVGLRDSVVAASEKLPDAQAGIQGLAALRTDVLGASEQLQASLDNARQLNELNAMLSGEAERIATARQNLQALLTIQQQLATATEQVTAAVQNFEILNEFQEEVSLHIRSLEALRRTLLEIAMMETTIGRVARTIEPLTQIGNLRRLGDEEVREAARVILDRRMNRFSQADSTTVSEVPAGDDAVEADLKPAAAEDSPVPEPRDAEVPGP
jgi:DNA repair exonuclease SbcCD ATPase subunit